MSEPTASAEARGGRREFFTALTAGSQLLPVEIEFPPEAFALMLMRTAMEVPQRLTAEAKAGKALKRAKTARAAGKAAWVGFDPLVAGKQHPHYARPPRG